MQRLTGNRLLDSLPPGTLKILLPQLEHIQLPVNTGFFKAHEVPRHVHFLLSGISSTVIDMGNGDSVETGIVGLEGFPERGHLIGPMPSFARCFMQIGGSALRMDFSAFQQLFLADPSVLCGVLRLLQQEALVLAQLSACNRLHGVEERLARWLLMVSDRVDYLTFALTQEFLAEMLGASRSTVNIAAGNLQRSGLMTFNRGQITIADRAEMERAACECYPVIRGYFAALYR